MSKAFVRDDAEALDDEGDAPSVEAIPAGSKNYITPTGHRRLRDELMQLLDVERPEVVRVVSWAASNGDRSENGDYLYGKKRLREIDRRIRFLTKRLELAEVVDPALRRGTTQAFFGATVRFLRNGERDETVTIVGVDEVDPLAGRISWVSPVGRALLKANEGDLVSLKVPGGTDELEVLEVRYG
ncbi:MAG: transcription elongation factor GreB [Betaproteobacteria bacterium]|nr:transcription elongation factor GreB [Betaproteobacteria bacterium]